MPLPGSGDGSAARATPSTAPDDANRVDDAAVRTAPPGKSIGIHLRSSPSGAEVAVDGVAVGRTPTYWNGTADGRAHEFTFTLPEHEIAHYQFVPVTSGVIHARLVAVSTTSHK